MDAILVRASALVLLALWTAQPGLAQKPGGKPQKPVAAKAGPPPPLDPWRGKFDAAKASAKERNVPLVVHILLDGEESTPVYVKEVLNDAELLRKSAGCVVILSNNGTHPATEVDVVVDGQKEKRKACSVFPMFTSCSQHQTSWDGLYAKYQEEGGVLHCPQTLVLTPTGEEALRVNTGGVPEAAEVAASITAVQNKFGPGLTQAQLDDVRKNLEVGRNLMTSKTFPDAWKTYTAVLAITTKTVYGEEAAREQAAALAGMQAELDRVVATIVPGAAPKGYQELLALQKSMAGTPLEKDVAERVKKVENDKAVRAEIAAWKLSVEADQILSQARDLYEQKQEKRGESLVRKLLGKRYASTPAADMARKLWPEIAKDEESKTPPAPKQSAGK